MLKIAAVLDWSDSLMRSIETRQLVNIKMQKIDYVGYSSSSERTIN
jgi:hypothetical protein